MEDTLVHEMVHMYDHVKFKVDWKDLRHHACSEVSVKDRKRSRLREMLVLVFIFGLSFRFERRI